MLCKILMARQRRKLQTEFRVCFQLPQVIPHPAAIPLQLQQLQHGTTEYTVQQGIHLGPWHRNSMAMALNIQRFWKQMAYRKAKISSPVMY